MITWSPSFRPAVTMASLPIQLAIVTGLRRALPSGPTVITMRDCSFCRIAACGTRIALLLAGEHAHLRELARQPLAPRDWRTPRAAARCPACGSTVLAEKLSLPLSATTAVVVRSRAARCASRSAPRMRLKSGSASEKRTQMGFTCVSVREQARIRVRGDEAALGALRAARDAGDRRRDRRVRKIELGFLQLRLGRGDGGIRGLGRWRPPCRSRAGRWPFPWRAARGASRR